MRPGKRLLVLVAFPCLLACGGGGAPRSALPDPLPLPADPSLLTITFVGDTCGHGVVMDETAPDPLDGVGDLLPPSDIFILNYEGVLVPPPHAPGECEPLPHSSLLDAHPHTADFLFRAPRSVATLANNHAFDCGAEGIDETARALSDRGLLVLGAGDDAEHACEPLLLRVNGVDLAILSYFVYGLAGEEVAAGPAKPGVATWTKCDGARRVAELAASGAYVVVCLHLHLVPSGTDETARTHRWFVEGVLDAGADLVVGHGSHVPQGVMARAGRLALLSLGNFLFEPGYALDDDQRDVVTASLSLHASAAVVTLRAGRLDSRGRPAPAPAGDRRRILQHVADLSRADATVVTVAEDRAFVVVER